MKGKLHKLEKGWVVEYLIDERTPIGHKSWWEELPLHPQDVKEIERDAKVFDNIEARIAAYPDVDFEIVKEDILTWARLTPYVSDDFQIGPDGAYEHVDVKEEALQFLATQAQELGFYDIPDEEIQKAADSGLYDGYSFTDGAKWYRDQIKNKVADSK